jgi:hypothetical protein
VNTPTPRTTLLLSSRCQPPYHTTKTITPPNLFRRTQHSHGSLSVFCHPKERRQRRNHIPRCQRRRVGLSLQSHRPTNTPPTEAQATPSNTPLPILPKLISYPRHIQHGDRHYRQGLTTVGPDKLGIQPHEINARSLRVGGATALLCANIDPNSIQLLSHWKSDAMLRYLHITANPHVRQYAKKMFTSGTSSFNPCFPNTSTHT